MTYSEYRYSRRESDATGWFVGIIVALALLATAYLVFSANEPQPTFTTQAGSTVRVDMPNGHGSGVYIGNGFILTAAHVTDGLSGVTITTDNGQKVDGRVLWGGLKQGGYDVGLVYVKDLDAAPAHLLCVTPKIGTPIHIAGNPEDAQFLTTWGKVSGDGITGYEKALGEFAWTKLVALDATLAPGVSGGPVFDADGSVVGIAVAVMVDPYRGPFPYSFMVPGSAVCAMLGRA